MVAAIVALDVSVHTMYSLFAQPSQLMLQCLTELIGSQVSGGVFLGIPRSFVPGVTITDNIDDENGISWDVDCPPVRHPQSQALCCLAESH